MYVIISSHIYSAWTYIHIKKITFAHMRLGKSIIRAEIQFIAKHESDTYVGTIQTQQVYGHR